MELSILTPCLITDPWQLANQYVCIAFILPIYTLGSVDYGLRDIMDTEP
jgi:hypothetical protein